MSLWIDTSRLPRLSCPGPITRTRTKGEGGHAGRMRSKANQPIQSPTLYTPEQRKLRDGTRWTLVQGILAPLQFIVFIASLVLIVRYLATGEGLALAHASIVAKTLALYGIMITGSIWEKVVFGKYLFADAFFWEDVFSMLVLALHTAYLLCLWTGWLSAAELMVLALAAYAAYIVNAGQFLIKLRAARLEAPIAREVAP